MAMVPSAAGVHALHYRQEWQYFLPVGSYQVAGFNQRPGIFQSQFILYDVCNRDRGANEKLLTSLLDNIHLWDAFRSTRVCTGAGGPAEYQAINQSLRRSASLVEGQWSELQLLQLLLWVVIISCQSFIGGILFEIDQDGGTFRWAAPTSLKTSNVQRPPYR